MYSYFIRCVVDKHDNDKDRELEIMDFLLRLMINFFYFR